MSDPSRARVSGPLAPFAPGFVAELLGAGYRPVSASFQLQLMAHLSRWMQANAVTTEALAGEELERFLAARRSAGYTNYLSPEALVPVVRYLRGLGVVPAAESPAFSAIDALLERYRAYLIIERGLAVVTTVVYADMVRPFVASRLETDGRLDLAGLAPSDVLAFVLAEAERRPRRSAKLLVTALRSLLRFLHVEGLTARPLASVVPSVAAWRLSGLPRSLEAEQVQALLASCSRQALVGRRDFAILLMLVRLGMRRGEVAALQLDDIDWRSGELLVRGKGSSVERLPLPVDVGEALADYLRHGRPEDAEGREVFVRVKAPPRALTPPGVSQVVVGAARRAGLGQIGAHRLRHTAATELLRAGAPLVEIGQLLRHRAELTTAIYAKVDRDRLRELARPWPGGAA
jgi:site-specific recombinase XerD